ncbi:MAG: hypothetical protein LBJ37_08885 [Paucimonas sp.]|jgi:hypothetical protein|nr:hypothetical protein [Paucimonas sp.]
MKVDLMREPSKQLILSVPPEEITSLRVWHCKYKSLKAIEQCVNLRELVIGTLPDDSVDFLSGLKQLEYLRILHMPKLRQISALAQLDAMICLSLATAPSWDSAGKRTVIDTLEPISALPALKHVELICVIPADGSLDPLASVPRLESARLGGYPTDLVTRFYAMTGVRDNFNPSSSFD